jgi:hypothetical protein
MATIVGNSFDINKLEMLSWSSFIIKTLEYEAVMKCDKNMCTRLI